MTAQTIFYLVASLVLLILFVFFFLLAFRVLGILKDTREMVRDFKLALDKTKKGFNSFFGFEKKRKDNSRP